MAAAMTHELRPRRACGMGIGIAEWKMRIGATGWTPPTASTAQHSLQVESEPFLFAANLCMFFLLDTCLLPCGSASVSPGLGQS